MSAEIPTVDDLRELKEIVTGAASDNRAGLALVREQLDRIEVRLGTQPQPTPPPTPAGFWLSGGSEHTGQAAELARWGARRGRPCSTVTVYTTRDHGWGPWVSTHASGGQIGVYADNTLDIVIQTSPFPVNVGATYAGILRGDYDPQYREAARLMMERAARRGRPDTWSGFWEANGRYMKWGGGPNPPGEVGHYSSPAQYRDAFAHVVTVMRGVWPALPVCWTINGHATPREAAPSGDAWELFPGWEFVDYAGIDDYDHYPKAMTREAFEARSRANGGIEWLAGKVRAENARLAAAGSRRRVKLRLPEWGVNGNPKDIAAGVAGGDHANYITWMWDLFRHLFAEEVLESEFYFADPTRIAGNVDSSLLDGNPKSAARYWELWRQAA